MQVVVDTLLTTYDKAGKGKLVVLLLHGWGDSLKTFDGLSRELAKHYTVLRLDLPGFGATQPPHEVWGLEQYAKFVHAFLVKLQIPAIHAVVGHSNGGAVAICGLAQQQLSAEKLVLLSSAGIRSRQNGRRFALKIVAKTGKAATFWLPARTKKRMRQQLYKTAGSDMLIAPHLEDTFKKTVRQDVQTDAASLRIPTLLVYGQDDAATPPIYGEILHNAIDGSTLHILPGGHFIHQDQLPEVAQTIQGFLA